MDNSKRVVGNMIKINHSGKIKINGLNSSNLPHYVISTIENKKRLAELITEQPKDV